MNAKIFFRWAKLVYRQEKISCLSRTRTKVVVIIFRRKIELRSDICLQHAGNIHEFECKIQTLAAEKFHGTNS